jgi:hypothetical protein
MRTTVTAALAFVLVAGIARASDGPPPCPPECPPPVKKVCVPVPDVRKVTKTVYRCKEEDYCLPKCPCLLRGLFRHGCCEPCAACGECGKPRVRHLLVKKYVTHECPSYKCEVSCVAEPPCGVPCPPPAAPAPEKARMPAPAPK